MKKQKIKQHHIQSIWMYNGDNLEVLNGLGVDLEKCIFVSDPPFNIGYHYNSYSDKMNEKQYYEWLMQIF